MTWPTRTRPFYSHALRWSNTARARRFLLDGGIASAQPPRNDGRTNGSKPWDSLIDLPAGFDQWPHLGQAQYLEMTIFLSQYLLSSQGDRMAMAHSVEGRYPFLDYRVVEFCNRLPPQLKLRGLTEKWLLKRLGKRLLPAEIWQRPKRPYRAPIHRSFFGAGRPTTCGAAVARSGAGQRDASSRPRSTSWCARRLLGPS